MQVMKDISDKENNVPSTETIHAWITLRLSEVMGVDANQINAQAPFTSFGLDSLTAFNLTCDLADWLGRDLSATLLWEYPNIVSLSQYLAEGSGSPHRNY